MHGPHCQPPLHHHTQVLLILGLYTLRGAARIRTPALPQGNSQVKQKRFYPYTSLLLCSGTSCSLENQNHEFSLTLKPQWSKVAGFRLEICTIIARQCKHKAKLGRPSFPQQSGRVPININGNCTGVLGNGLLAGLQLSRP